MYLYTYAELQVEVWTNCRFVFFEEFFSFPTKKRKKFESKTTDISDLK